MELMISGLGVTRARFPNLGTPLKPYGFLIGFLMELMISSLGASRPRFLDLATPSGREGKEERKDGKEEGTGGRMVGVAKDIHTHIHPVDLGVGGRSVPLPRSMHC